MDLLASSCTNQCQLYNTLEILLPQGYLGLNAFNHPWTYLVSYVFPPPALVSLILSKFPVEHVTGLFRLLTLWHLVGWRILGFPQFLACWKTFLIDVPSSKMLSWLGAQVSAIIALNPLAAQRCVLHRQRFSCLVCGKTQVSTTKVLSVMLERMGKLMCSRRCTKQCHFCL